MISFFFVCSPSSESFLTFNTNLLETNFFNIFLLISLLLYTYKVSFRTTLEIRQEEILQNFENLERDLSNSFLYFSLGEKAFSQNLFWLYSWKKVYKNEKNMLVKDKYENLQKGIKKNFEVIETVFGTFETKLFLSLQRYLLFLTAGKILRKFFAISLYQQSKFIQIAITQLGES